MNKILDEKDLKKKRDFWSGKSRLHVSQLKTMPIKLGRFIERLSLGQVRSESAFLLQIGPFCWPLTHFYAEEISLKIKHGFQRSKFKVEDIIRDSKSF